MRNLASGFGYSTAALVFLDFAQLLSRTTRNLRSPGFGLYRLGFAHQITCADPLER